MGAHRSPCRWRDFGVQCKGVTTSVPPSHSRRIDLVHYIPEADAETVMFVTRTADSLGPVSYRQLTRHTEMEDSLSLVACHAS